MSAVVIIVLFLFGLLVYSPSRLLAQKIKAKQKGVGVGKISDDEIWVLTWFICVPVYLTLWWLFAITGLLELFTKEFK